MKTQTERGIRFDISCEVCRDLMPLVRDGVASADSEALVRAHTERCGGCRTMLESETPPEHSMPDDARVLRRLRWRLLAQSVLFALVGVLGAVARKYAHRIPFIVKLNHNELLSYPNSYDQVMFGTVRDAWNMGAAAVGATIYFGSEESRRQLVEIAEAFDYAHELGMATILWCYLRNGSFRKDGVDYHASADLTGQADHLGVTIKADIVKQKLPENNGGFRAIGFGKTRDEVYTKLTTDHPIDLCRYQVANGYMGRVGLINSGGESHGASDLQEAVMTAVVNKRAGGMGLISGRKAFQRPMDEGIALLNAIQDVYLDPEVTIA